MWYVEVLWVYTDKLVSKQDKHVIDVILVSLMLTLSIFHIFF